MSQLIADITHEFRRYKDQADRAVAGLSDEDFFRRPGEQVNPVALIVKHLAGNLQSRWTDFLTTDGEAVWLPETQSSAGPDARFLGFDLGD